MADRNRNKKNQLKDFLRYRDNRMSDEERNSFEKELQKDPFAEDAAEGFSMISADEAKDDLLILQKQLDKKLKRRPAIVFYRIAASVAILMVITTLFIITQRKNQTVTLSENIIQKPESPLSIFLPESQSVPEGKSSVQKEVLHLSAPHKSKTDDQIAALKDEEQQVAEQQITESELATITVSEVIKPDLTIVTAGEDAVKSVVAEKKMDMARAAGAPAAAKSESFRDYIPPQPVVGKDSFDLYVEKNIHNPEPKDTEQQVVVISFRVRTDSTITDIRIISSPGQPWSKEATKLIKEGPVWKPAVESGKLIEDVVKVRIVFR